MTNFPCWADIAARDYAADPTEARMEAIAERAEQLESWSVECVRNQLKPHECEALDELLNSIAERELDAEARDNFVEPDWN